MELKAVSEPGEAPKIYVEPSEGCVFLGDFIDKKKSGHEVIAIEPDAETLELLRLGDHAALEECFPIIDRHINRITYAANAAKLLLRSDDRLWQIGKMRFYELPEAFLDDWHS